MYAVFENAYGVSNNIANQSDIYEQICIKIFLLTKSQWSEFLRLYSKHMWPLPFVLNNKHKFSFEVMNCEQVFWAASKMLHNCFLYVKALAL